MAPPPPGIAAVIAALSVDPSRPRLTGYGEAGRTELSGTVLLNWASKVAGLLLDELGAGPGDRVVIRSPANWQTAGILVGALWAGVTVTSDDDPTAAAAFVPDTPGGADASCDEVFVVSGHPLGAPSTTVAAHQRDYTGAVLGQADRFTPRWSVAGSAAALIVGDTATSQEELASLLTAAGSGLGPADRALSIIDFAPGAATANGAATATGSTTATGLVAGLLAPLGAGAGVIHCADVTEPDQLARRAISEKATATLGLDLPGLPRRG